MEYFKSRNGLLPNNPKNKKNFTKTYSDVVSSRNDAMVVLKTGERAALTRLKKLPRNLNLNKDEELFKLLKDNAAKELVLEEERKRGFKPILQREDVDNMLTLLENPREPINSNLTNSLVEVFKRADNKLNEVKDIATSAKDTADKVQSTLDTAKEVTTNDMVDVVNEMKKTEKQKEKEERDDLKAFITKHNVDFKFSVKSNSKPIDSLRIEANRIKSELKKSKATTSKEAKATTPNESDETNESDDDIQGSGLFSSISSMIGKYAPSIIKQAKIIAPSILKAGKKVIQNPKNQKAAFDFVKEKLKKKESEKPRELTEREQLFQMFKNKEITADEYRNLKSDLPVQEIKPIQEIKKTIEEVKPIEDENLKNLSNEFDPKKIYLDLLSKKQITPEQYLNIISGGKKLNLSKPIDKDNFIEETTLQQGKGFKRIKKKYKT